MPERSRTPLSNGRTPSPPRKRKAEEAFREPRSHRDKDRERDHGRDRQIDRGREHRSNKRERSRSRSREKHRSSKDQPPSRSHRRSRSRSRDRQRRRSRSRSPARTGTTSTRTRSPPPKIPRTDHDRHAGRPRTRDGGDDSKRHVRSERPQLEAKAAESKVHLNGDTAMTDDGDEDAAIKKMMGFSGFRSTKNTKVPGNQIYGVRKEKKTEYRQYMNRVGGFNRPLSPSR